MKTSSRKSKGRRLQNYVRDKIITEFNLSNNDVRSTPMGVTGADIQLSDAAIKKFPFSIECKNQEKTKIWEWWEQASRKDKKKYPLLIIHKNNSEILAVLKFDDFLKINKKR